MSNTPPLPELPPLTTGDAWRDMQNHAATLRTLHLRELFAADARRGGRPKLQAAGI